MWLSRLFVARKQTDWLTIHSCISPKSTYNHVITWYIQSFGTHYWLITIRHTILVVCLADCLHVFFSGTAQIEHAKVVFAKVKVSNSEVIEIHCSGITQRTMYSARRWVENVACNWTQHSHSFLVVSSTVFKLTLEKHRWQCLHTKNKYCDILKQASKTVHVCCLISRWASCSFSLLKITTIIYYHITHSL